MITPKQDRMARAALDPTWTVPSENSFYVSCLERPSRVFALHPRPPVGGRATKVLGAAAQKRRSQSRRYPRTLPAEWWRRGVRRRSSRHIGLLGGREPRQTVRRRIAWCFACQAGEAQAFPSLWH